MGAYAALLTAVDTLDPADAAGYAQITLHLEALEAANNLLFPALNTFYTGLDAAISVGAWDTLFSTYVDLLAAIDIGTLPTVDDVVWQLETLISELLSSLLAVFDADDLAAEVLRGSLRCAWLAAGAGEADD